MLNSTHTAWAQAHPAFVASYMDRDKAERRAEAINGRCLYVWASGIDTWHVHRSLCLCGTEGPDYFGNYSQIINPECPVCGNAA